MNFFQNNTNNNIQLIQFPNYLDLKALKIKNFDNDMIDYGINFN